MSYEDNIEYYGSSYNGHYYGEVKCNSQEPVVIDNLSLWNVAEIYFDVEYYYSSQFGGSMDLDINSVQFLNEQGEEIASTHKLTDKQLIELGFPYDELLNKAAQEAE